MNPTHYRLVLNGLIPGADIKKIAVYLQKDLELPHEKIHGLLTSTPRVIKEFKTQHNAESSLSTLSKSGCLISMEPIVAYPSFPFCISQKHEGMIKRELSKVLRCRTSLVLLLVQIDPGDSHDHFPSMLGPFEEQVIAHFRESDTVIAVDDTRLIILGFATDKHGVVPIQSKTQRVMKQILGSDIAVSFGYSVFPDDGQTVVQLMKLAGKPRSEKSNRAQAEGEKPLHETAADSDAESSPGTQATPIELCFTRARGRIFKRLLNMDAVSLGQGLSGIPLSGQKEFIARLPFDSPLSSELDKLAKSGPRTLVDQSYEKHFSAIIQQMELEAHIARQDILLEKVLLKLNQTEDLPTLPSVAMQIFNIASDPNSSGTELAAIVTKDPALTSKLLKTVNSAFYGSPQKISSVKHAIVLLGSEEIVDIAFGLAAAKVFDVKPLEGVLNPKVLWHHAICSALIAQSISRTLPQFRDVGVFTATLLHDVGKIFLIANYPDIYKDLTKDSKTLDLPLFEMEEDYFGLHHAIVGKYLASQWNLPEMLINAISYHHQPYSSPGESAVAAITGLADYLYYRSSEAGLMPGEANSRMSWLTAGHWLFLAQLFKDLNTRMLDDMTRTASAIMEENREYLDYLT
jgi:HD-like signal output (HDOD) protein